RASLLRGNRGSRRRICRRARRGNARDDAERRIRSRFVLRRKKRGLPHLQQNRPHHERHAVRRRRQARPLDHRSRRRHPHRRRRLRSLLDSLLGGSMKVIRGLFGLTVALFLTVSGNAAVKDRVTILYDAFSDNKAVTKDWGFSAL